MSALGHEESTTKDNIVNTAFIICLIVFVHAVIITFFTHVFCIYANCFMVIVSLISDLWLDDTERFLCIYLWNSLDLTEMRERAYLTRR